MIITKLIITVYSVGRGSACVMALMWPPKDNSGVGSLLPTFMVPFWGSNTFYCPSHLVSSQMHADCTLPYSTPRIPDYWEQGEGAVTGSVKQLFAFLWQPFGRHA